MSGQRVKLNSLPLSVPLRLPLTRRCWLRRAGLAATTPLLALAGCGFALRQAPVMPFQRIALVGFAARSPLGHDLRQHLQHALQVVDTPAQAEVVLQVLTDRRERSVVASTAAGQVRELQLRLRFEFRLLTPGGRELSPVTELLLSRDMSYSETVALAKAQEEAEIYSAMQADVAQQVAGQLAQLRLAAPVAAAPASPSTPAATPTPKP